MCKVKMEFATAGTHMQKNAQHKSPNSLANDPSCIHMENYLLFLKKGCIKCFVMFKQLHPSTTEKKKNVIYNKSVLSWKIKYRIQV